MKFFMLLFAVVFISCEKETLLPGTAYYKSQLQCNGDQWQRGSTDDETLQNLIDYFATKGIKVKEAELTSAPADRVFCTACNCPTGRTYIIRVIEGSEKDLNKEGFYK